MTLSDAGAAALPPAERVELTLGFMRLADAAPLVVARELGLFARFARGATGARGVLGQHPRQGHRGCAGRRPDAGADAAAHLLGVGGLRCPLLTGLMLNLNGNAITLAAGLYEQLAGAADPSAAPLRTVQALARHVTATGERLTLATVYPFSTHTLQLRQWLAAGGIDPDARLRLVVLPPEQMVDSLAQGLIDGFCVGEPWNSAAVQAGVGVIAASGYEVWNNAPERCWG